MVSRLRDGCLSPITARGRNTAAARALRTEAIVRVGSQRQWRTTRSGGATLRCAPHRMIVARCMSLHVGACCCTSLHILAFFCMRLRGAQEGIVRVCSQPYEAPTRRRVPCMPHSPCTPHPLAVSVAHAETHFG